MKKLITLLAIFISAYANAQVAAVNDTVRITPTAPTFSPQFQQNIFTSGGVNYRMNYLRNPSTGTYDAVVYSKYLRAFYLSKADSILNSGYITHGYFNQYAIKKSDSSLFVTPWQFLHGNNTISGDWTFAGGLTVNNELNLQNGVQFFGGLLNLAQLTGHQTRYSTNIYQSVSGDTLYSVGSSGNAFQLYGNYLHDNAGVRYVKFSDTGTTALPSIYSLSHRNWDWYGTHTFHNLVNFNNGAFLSGTLNINNSGNLRFTDFNGVASNVFTAWNYSGVFGIVDVANHSGINISVDGTGGRLSDYFGTNYVKFSDTGTLVLPKLNPVYTGKLVGPRATVGDTLRRSRIYGMGTSVMVGFGSSIIGGVGVLSTIVKDSTYLQRVARSKGILVVNRGLSGRFLQQSTVGDSSIYSQRYSIPSPVSPNDIYIIEGQVNDAYHDSTVYTPAIHQVQLDSVVVAAHSKGWAYNRILILNPAYYNPNTGNPTSPNTEYRHSLFSTAEQTVATARGCLFYDGYATFKAAWLINPNLLDSRVLHPTSEGNALIASNLTAFLAPYLNTITFVSNNPRKVIGSDYVYGDINARQDVNVANNVNVSNNLFVNNWAYLPFVQQFNALNTPTVNNQPVIVNSLGIAGGSTIKGGTGATDQLVLVSTSGTGTSSSVGIAAKVGTNASITAMSILNSGSVGVGLTPTVNPLEIGGVTGAPLTTGGDLLNGIVKIRINGSNLGEFFGLSTTNNYGWDQVQSIGAKGTNFIKLINPNGGNVGINTGTSTMPTHNLEVTGTVAVSGHVTFEGVTSTGATGAGKFVFDGTPTLVTPVLGVATATSINKVAITAPATSATLTLANSSTFTLNGAFNTQFTGSANATFTLPGASQTLASLAGTETLTNKTLTTPKLTGYTVATLPAGTVGMIAYVTDALTPTFGNVLVGGGAVVAKAFYNGTNWINE